MFEEYNNYQFILVTGPQRSGTTICARMMAEDTGKEFLPEGAMAVPDKRFEENGALQVLLEKLRHENRTAVIQCPIQSRFIHEFAAEDTLIVCMIRDLGDIRKSEERIGWGDSRQRALYSDVMKILNVEYNQIAYVKYLFWELYQSMYISMHGGHVLEVIYDSLVNHKLWVENRHGWSARKISPSEDYSYYSPII